MGPDPAVAAVRRAVRAALAGLAGPDADRPVLVATSGGPDSTALAAATAFVAGRTGRAAGAITVDHGLQAGSDRQAMRAADAAYELGLDPVHLLRVTVEAAGGPEGAARVARYAAIETVAGDALVLLGHTRDDQAETVLLGLGRGSGPRSIVGMRALDGRYLRPLLDLRRETTIRACAALDLAVWHDPHNLDPRFTRVRLRQEVLPLLEDVLGGGVHGALARTAGLLRDDLEALDEVAAAVAARLGTGPLTVADLAGQPRAVRTRVLRAWVARAETSRAETSRAQTWGAVRPGRALTAAHLAALDDLLVAWHGQGSVDLPGGYAVERRSGRLELAPRSTVV